MMGWCDGVTKLEISRKVRVFGNVSLSWAGPEPDVWGPRSRTKFWGLYIQSELLLHCKKTILIKEKS